MILLSVVIFFIVATIIIILYSIYNTKPAYVRCKEKHHYPIPIPPDAPPSEIECGVVKVINPDVLKCFDQLCPFYDPDTRQWAPVVSGPGGQAVPCNTGGASRYETCDFGKDCPGPQKPADPPTRRQCNQRPPDVDKCFTDGAEFGSDIGNCCSSYDPVTKDWSDPICHNNCNAIAKIPLTDWKWKDPNCNEEDRSLCKDVSASYYYDCKNAFTQCKNNKKVTPTLCTNASDQIKNCFSDPDKCNDYNENTKKWMTPSNEADCGVEGANAQYYDKCSFASMCPGDATTAECDLLNINLFKSCFLNKQLQQALPSPLTPCASFDQINKTWKAHNAFIGPLCVTQNISRYQTCDFNDSDEEDYGINCSANPPTTAQFTDSICPSLGTFLAKAIDPTADPVVRKKAQDLGGLLGGCLDPNNDSFKDGGCRQFYNEIEKKWMDDDLCKSLCNRIIDGAGVNVSFYEQCIPSLSIPVADPGIMNEDYSTFFSFYIHDNVNYALPVDEELEFPAPPREEDAV